MVLQAIFPCLLVVTLVTIVARDITVASSLLTLDRLLHPKNASLLAIGTGRRPARLAETTPPPWISQGLL